MKNAGLSKLVVSDRGLLDRLKNQTEDRRRSFGPESLLLLLDGSSSMRGTPWEQVDKAVHVLARASDSALCRLGVAIFSESADVFSSFKSDFRAVAATIPQYPPGGMTAMRSGLELACKLSWPTPAAVWCCCLMGCPPTAIHHLRRRRCQSRESWSIRWGAGTPTDTYWRT